ncbi:hypothetical protein J6X04_03680 [Candidatus Saccharibacteria bacterium]|nr:hypothetical protein [Candidatus Saccharibacteria bacterium]
MAKLRRWGLYFKEKYGEENRKAIMKDFVDFHNDSQWDEMIISGKCMLGGKVYERNGFHDGDVVTTSNVEKIERINRGTSHGVACDLMCATTASGSKYYFYSDDLEPYMYIMMDDIKNRGGIKPDKEYYLPIEFWGIGLL